MPTVVLLIMIGHTRICQHYTMLFRVLQIITLKKVLEITLLVVTDAIPVIRDVDSMLCGFITRIPYIKHVHFLKILSM